MEMKNEKKLRNNPELRSGWTQGKERRAGLGRGKQIKNGHKDWDPEREIHKVLAANLWYNIALGISSKF